MNNNELNSRLFFYGTAAFEKAGDIFSGHIVTEIGGDMLINDQPQKTHFS